MSVSVNDVILVAPELSSEETTRINTFIGYAQSQLDEDVFGELYDQAVIYLTAHMMTLANRSGTGGTVSSETVGDLSRSYQANSSDNSLDSTSYGAEFKRIRSMVVTGPVVLKW